MKPTYAQHLIKMEDLNPHQTFFAGRCAEWLIESSYFAINQCLETKDCVLMVQHGINYRSPMRLGDIVTFESKIVNAGKSTVTVYTKVYRSREPEVITAYGFSTFAHLDADRTSAPHGLVVEAVTEEEKALQQEAAELLAMSLKYSKDRKF